MKRITLTILAAVVAIGLAGCEYDSTKTAGPPAPPFTGGTLTRELVLDENGLEGQATDAITDCSSFGATNGGIFYDDSEGKWKKCQDNSLTDLDTTGSGNLGSNLSSSSNDLTTDNDIIQLIGTAEDIDIEFGTNSVDITTDTGVTEIDFIGIALKDDGVALLTAAANTIDSDQYVDGSIDLAHMSAESVDSDQYVDGSVDAVHLADADFGDFSVSSGVATLDADVVAAAEMADADHGAVSWASGVATVETITVADNESTDEGNAIVFVANADVDGATDAQLESDGTLTYNPSTGVVTATGFAGALTGNVTGTASLATTVTIADNESTDETNAVLFTPGGDVDGGNLTPETDGDFTYNPSTGTVAATIFDGTVAGSNLDISNTTAETTIAADDKIIIYDTSATANRAMTRGNFVAGIGAGQAVIFDIEDDGGNDSTDVGEIATSGDTNSIFTEPSADKILIDLTKDWPKADLADAVVIADNESTDETNAILFTPGGDLDGGNLTPESDGDLTYNPSTGTLSATILTNGTISITTNTITGIAAGGLPDNIVDNGMMADDAIAAAEMADADHGAVSWASGVATVETVTVTDNENTSEANAITFVANADLDGATDAALESDGDLTYNPSTGTIAATNVTASATVGAADLTASDDIIGQDDLQLDSDSAIIQLGEDQDVTLTHVADSGINLNESFSIADDKFITFGGNLAGRDWTLGYDETTSDALEFTHTAGAGADVSFDLNDNAADSTYTVTNSDGTYEANLDVEGDGTFGGTLTAASISTAASASPGWAAEDSDADAVGTFTFSIDAYTAGYDSQILFKVDDSAGEDTTYMTVDGSNEVIDFTKPVTMDSTLAVTGTVTIGTTGTISEETNTMTFDDGDGVPITLEEIRTMVAGAEDNDLEGDGAVGIANTEVFIGTGAGTGNYRSISGDASLANTGALSLAADSVDDAHINWGEAGLENSVEGLIFDADTETVTGVWTVGTTVKLQFRDTGIYLNSANDGYLDIEADTGIRFNGPVTFVNEGAITLPNDTVTMAMIDDDGNFIDLTGNWTTTGTVTAEQLTSTDDLTLSSDGAIITVGSGGPTTLTHITGNDTLALNTGLDITGATGLILQNDESITNATNTQILLTADSGENLAFDLDTATDNEIEITSPGGATSLIITGMTFDATVKTTESTTATVTVTGNSGVYYNNDDDAIEFDLPAAATGKQFCFHAYSYAQAITIDPDGTDQIMLDGALESAGEAIVSTGAANDFICLHGKADAVWVAFGKSGTWDGAVD